MYNTYCQSVVLLKCTTVTINSRPSHPLFQKHVTVVSVTVVRTREVFNFARQESN